MKPLANLLARAAIAASISLGAVAVTSTSASAYVACRGHDCWHTDTRVRLPGVTLAFHNDNWAHRKGYNWHEADAAHDWNHGYWDHGTWRAK